MAASAGGRPGHWLRLPLAGAPHTGRPEAGMLTAHFDSTVLVPSLELLSTKAWRLPAVAQLAPLLHSVARDSAAASAAFCNWRRSHSRLPTSTEIARKPKTTPTASSTPTIVPTAPRSLRCLIHHTSSGTGHLGPAR